MPSGEFSGHMEGGGGRTSRPSRAAEPRARSLTSHRLTLCPRLVAEEIAQGDLVPEQTSPLGAPRHCAAVKRRMSAGEHGACIVGNVFLLTREALAEELATLPARMSRKKLDVIQREIAGGLRLLREVR